MNPALSISSGDVDFDTLWHCEHAGQGDGQRAPTIINDKKFRWHAPIPQALQPIHDALG